MRPWLIVGFLLVFWGGDSLRAEHAEDHRYTIWGYVKDTEGTPLRDVLVVVTDGQGSRLGVTRSRGNGGYSIRLHLHNNDLGKRLIVTAGKVALPIRVTFDPDNTTRARMHRVDFLGAQAVETLGVPRSLAPYLLLALGIAVITIPTARYVARRAKRHTSQKTSKRRKHKPTKTSVRQRARRK